MDKTGHYWTLSEENSYNVDNIVDNVDDKEDKVEDVDNVDKNTKEFDNVDSYNDCLGHSRETGLCYTILFYQYRI